MKITKKVLLWHFKVIYVLYYIKICNTKDDAKIQIKVMHEIYDLNKILYEIICVFLKRYIPQNYNKCSNTLNKS